MLHQPLEYVTPHRCFLHVPTDSLSRGNPVLRRLSWRHTVLLLKSLRVRGAEVREERFRAGVMNVRCNERHRCGIRTTRGWSLVSIFLGLRGLLVQRQVFLGREDRRSVELGIGRTTTVGEDRGVTPGIPLGRLRHTTSCRNGRLRAVGSVPMWYRKFNVAPWKLNLPLRFNLRTLYKFCGCTPYLGPRPGVPPSVSYSYK